MNLAVDRNLKSRFARIFPREVFIRVMLLGMDVVASASIMRDHPLEKLIRDGLTFLHGDGTVSMNKLRVLPMLRGYRTKAFSKGGKGENDEETFLDLGDRHGVDAQSGPCFLRGRGIPQQADHDHLSFHCRRTSRFHGSNFRNVGTKVPGPAIGGGQQTRRWQFDRIVSSCSGCA